MSDLNDGGLSRSQLLRDALLTLTAVLFAFAALDDITTDNATTFTFEWLGLGVCAAWLLTVSWRLVRGKDRWFGAAATSRGLTRWLRSLTWWEDGLGWLRRPNPRCRRGDGLSETRSLAP